jgi:O-antigen ligase/Flp pilus assembly protein TadD
MKIIKLLNKIITIGLLLTLLLPFVTVPFLVFPYITGRNIVFRIITEIIFTLYLLVVVLNKKTKGLISPISSSIFIFIMILLVTTLTGVNPARSFFSNFERMEGLITFMHLAAWFVVAVGTFKKREQWEFFFKTNLLVSAVVSAYSILQVMHILPVDQGRISGTFGNPIYLSYYMYFNIFLSVFFLAKIKKFNWQSSGYAILTAAQIFVLLQTATRGAILGFLFGVVLAAFWIIISGKKRAWTRRLALIFLLLASLTVAAFLGLKNMDSVKNHSFLGRFASISIKNLAQDTERVAVWKIAWQGIIQRPLLGWGLENFDTVFDRNYDPRLAGSTQWFDRTHNTYLEWWLVSGIFGLLAYLGIFAAAFYTIIKCDSAALFPEGKSVLVGLLAGYMVINFFDFDNLISYLAFFSILAFLHALSKMEADAPKKQQQPDHKRISAIQLVIISAIIINGTALITILNGKPIYSLLMLNQAFENQPEGYEKNLEYFQKALNVETMGRAEICRRLSEIAVKFNFSDDGQITEAVKQKIFAMTCREMEKLSEEEPVYARNEIAFGAFLARFGHYDEALLHLTKAHTLAPRKPAILIEMALAYLSKQQNEKGVSAARQAFELNRDFEESRKIYALSAIVSGKLELARSLLVPVYHTLALDDDRFLMVYSMTHQWRQVIEIYSARLEKNPGDINMRVNLAQAFLQNGERDKAVEQIEAAMRYDHSFTEQGLRLLQKIGSGSLK